MAERILRGRPASPGLAIGPLVRLPKVARVGRPTLEQRGDHLRPPRAGRPAVERAAWRRRSSVRGRSWRLCAASDGMGAEILEFQLALLEDPTFLERRWRRSPKAYRRVRPGSMSSTGTPVLRGFGGRVFPRPGQRSRDVAVASLRALGGEEDRPLPLLPGAIVVGEDLAPRAFWRWTGRSLGGVALERGSPPRMWPCWPAPVACRWRPTSARCRRAATACSTARMACWSASRSRHPRGLRPPAGRAPPAQAEESAQLTRPAVTAAGERVE